MRNIYYMANTFQIWKELQANFIKPKTQYTCSFMSKCIQRIHCCSPEFPSIWKTWMEQISLHRNRSKKVCAGSAKEITKQWAQNWICFTPSTWARNYIMVQHGNHRAWWNLQQKSLNLKLTRFYFLSVLICQPWSLAAVFGRKSKETKTQRGRCANYFHASYTKKSSEKEFTSQGEFPSFCLSYRQKT